MRMWGQGLGHKKTREDGASRVSEEISSRLSGSASTAHLLDDAAYGRGGLGANGEPFVSFFQVEGVIFTFGHGIVSAELLDIATITALAAVYSDDFVIGPVFGSLASESKCYHMIWWWARKLCEFGGFAKNYLV